MSRHGSPASARPTTPVPPRNERTVPDIVARLEQFPFRPKPLPVGVAFGKQFLVDSSELLFGNSRGISSPHRFPRSFEPVLMHGAGDVHLSGMRAMQDRPAPALILCHGLLMTMHCRSVIRIAVRAFERWGYHVLAWDQRGCGASAWLGPQQQSAGWHEGEDLVELARELRRDPRVTSVHAVGISLGGATVMNGARVVTDSEVAKGQPPSLDSVLSISGPTHAASAIRHISTKPPLRDDFRVLWQLFRLALRYNAWRMGEDRGDGSFQHAVDTILAPSYDVDTDEFVERPSAVNFADRLQVPTLHLHARDDFCVLHDQAERLERAAIANDNVHVWSLDKGNHAAFEALDPRWTYSVIRRWCQYWS